VYLAGGRVLNGSFTGAVSRYDPVADVWQAMPDLPKPLYGPGAAVYGGKIYVAGGSTSPGAYTAETQVYDLGGGLTGSWQRGPDLLWPRSQPQLLSLSDSLWIIGGIELTAPPSPGVTRIDALSLPSGAWVTIGALPQPMPIPVVAVDREHRIFIAERDRRAPTIVNASGGADTSATAWSNVPEPPGTAFVTGGQLLHGADDRIYVVGVVATAAPAGWAFSFASQAWSQVATPAAGIIDYAGTQGPDGRLYLIGGGVGTLSPIPMTNVQAYGPVFTLSPASGPAGASVSIVGDNFASSAHVTVQFDGPATVGWDGGQTSPSGQLPASLQFTVPSVAPGAYRVTVVDDRSRFPVEHVFAVK
jgi:hypothetical protein